MEGNVIIDGVSSSTKSRLIVRDSDVDDDTLLVVAASSIHYTDNRIKNWLFASGLEPGREYPSGA
jgi:hypothetical protein